MLLQYGIILEIFLTLFGEAFAYVRFGPEKKVELREQVRSMFYHAYNSYIDHAFPLDELRPLTCDGVDTWGSYSLTLIDALDTLLIMGNSSEFRRVAAYLPEKLDFNRDVNVSVFETNIRVVGGLLAAHLMSKRAGIEMEPGWPCTGPLLRLAEDMARRLLPAFQTNTGMPYGTVNLRHGVPSGETPITCTASVGTFILEFGVLSRLTGNPVYEDTAMRALRSLWGKRTRYGLVGNHIDTQTGEWKAIDAGIGAGIDSYYEYLAKAGAAFQNTELIASFLESYEAIQKHVNHDDWYFWVSSASAQVTMAIFQSLEAFWPGTLATLGDGSTAYRSLMHYFYIWRHYGGTPEFFDVPKAREVKGREGYPLRPEFIESVYHVYQVNKDPLLLQMGAEVLKSIEDIARVPCGYATVKNIRTHTLENRMESFFLAETLKYLYLLFDEDNFIHHDDGIGEIHNGKNMCVLSSGSFVFNTEAHPFDMSSFDCCSVSAAPLPEDLFDITAFVKERSPRPVGHPEKNSDSTTDNLMDSVVLKEAEEASIAKSCSSDSLDLTDSFGEEDQTVPSRSLRDYCACDVPMKKYVRFCVKGADDLMFLCCKCPERYCNEFLPVVLAPPKGVQTDKQTLVDFDSHPPVGNPLMLTCEVDGDLDFVAYGQIN